MGKLITVKNVTKKYKTGTTENKVVNNANLEVQEGDFLVIMGSSGSGKTSLLHLLAGIDDFNEGRIEYKNQELASMNEREKTLFRRENIGMVFQHQCLIPDLSVYENIMLPLMLNRGKKEKASMKTIISQLCRKFDLEEHMGKYPSQLSGGQQQRVAILRAVVGKPALLLCDEPTGSLNSAHSNKIIELLTELNLQGQTIILVTHDIKVGARGKRVIYIQDGNITGEFNFLESTQNKEEELRIFLQKRGW